MTTGDGRWLEVEYQALRDEILALTAERHATIRFYLPAAASVYAVPHILQQTTQVYLWILSSAAASLLLLAMVRTLLSCTVGIWSISAYIQQSIEPRTN